MAIRIDIVGRDKQNLPVVSWIEDRNMFAGGQPVRMSCFIRRDQQTGELLFVQDGPVRHRQDISARPWAKLVSFELGSAEDLYRTAQEKALMQAVGQKLAAARVALTDGAHVLLAHFGDVPMHLNCADATVAEAQELYGVLKREFIDKRLALHEAGCRGEFVWQGETFEEFVPPELKRAAPWQIWLIDASIATVLALLGWGIYELVLR